MKIKVWCDSGANIKSSREEIIDTQEEWGISDVEWNTLSEEERHELVMEWAWERLEVGWRGVSEV